VTAYVFDISIFIMKQEKLLKYKNRPYSQIDTLYELNFLTEFTTGVILKLHICTFCSRHRTCYTVTTVPDVGTGHLVEMFSCIPDSVNLVIARLQTPTAATSTSLVLEQIGLELALEHRDSSCK